MSTCLRKMQLYRGATRAPCMYRQLAELQVSSLLDCCSRAVLVSTQNDMVL